MSSLFVLDAWALLALLQGEEPAALRVKHLLQEAADQQAQLFISAVNLGEVYYRIGRVKGRDEAEGTLEAIRRLPLRVLSATDEMVLAAASLKIDYLISYADAFAAAAAERLSAVLVTGDPELEQMQGRIRIEKLQRSPRYQRQAKS